MVRKPHRLADSAPEGEPRHHAGTLPISQLPDKGRVTCQGRVESVTFLPADQAAGFSAMVSDSEPGGSALCGWDAGAQIRLEGMLSMNNGLPTMFNPRYEILSRQEDE